jgi:hypothetical protein
MIWNEDAFSKKLPLSHKSNEFILGGADRTEVLCLLGHRQRETQDIGNDPVLLTKSYFAGSIFYEFPGQQAEELTFCYHRDDHASHFRLYRDYLPYNGRQAAKAGQ